MESTKAEVKLTALPELAEAVEEVKGMVDVLENAVRGLFSLAASIGLEIELPAAGAAGQTED